MLLKRLLPFRHSAPLALATVIAALAQGQVPAPQACDGVARLGPVTVLQDCDSASTKQEAWDKVFYFNPNIPPCANCEDPVGPCLGQGLGYTTEPAITCFRLINNGLWICCAFFDNDVKYEQICACEEL